MKFRSSLPSIDLDRETGLIVDFIKDQVSNKYKRDGIVVGISGGVDSAVTTVLSLKAVGAEKLVGVLMPEKESNPISAKLAKELCEKFGVSYVTRDLTPVLDAYGAYRVRDDVVRKYFPEFDGTQKWKLVQPGNLLANEAVNFYSIKIETPAGFKSKRITPADIRTIVGATDLKHRSRMATLYQIAETENYMVAGTTNQSEAALGFYVKYGDGGVDIEPLEHLYKTYVYQIARHIGVIQGIIDRLPSPDTFSAEVADEEFFFRLPYTVVDLLLWAIRLNEKPEKVAAELKLDVDKIKRAIADLKHKNEISEHIRQKPGSMDRQLP